MKIKSARLKNFRRLECVDINFEESETLFVGPNNSGKTSASTAFRLFLLRNDFKIHDFSVARIIEIDAFGESGTGKLPAIEMDLWFSISPDIQFGRAFSLLPNLDDDLDEVGIRIRYCAADPEKLRKLYLKECPAGQNRKSLSRFLAAGNHLSTSFELQYYALQRQDPSHLEFQMEPKEAKRVLKSLIRIDFVDAQRNIDDIENGRANRLSSAFATFYRKNLDQAEANEEATRVIDKNNESLTEHYDQHFKSLMAVIQGLGVPAVNDRVLKIVSTLSPESILQGNVDLLYVDEVLKHELPEAYNGLGFKNLIYMAIQISHFHIQWMRTDTNRPLCQIIFIEEPEVHIHAQVQQTFIENIWKIIKKTSIDANEAHMVPQLCVTTHSSHILDRIDFEKVRYFQRCLQDGADPTTAKTYNASIVKNLRDFRPQKSATDSNVENEAVTLRFLKQYLELTHCDLFFADAAILIEGAAERLLMGVMIEKDAPDLKNKYLTTLEVGGAYAHRFASLFEFLGIPCLAITDIDSVDPDDKRKSTRADTEGAVTSNACIKSILNKEQISELATLATDDLVAVGGMFRVAFQQPVAVVGHPVTSKMHGRTFEETFVYENIALVRDEKISIGIDLPDGIDFNTEYDAVYKRIKKSTFKKTGFALDVASSAENWTTPAYIREGLQWLVGVLEKNITPE